jgi:uncharacterized membrane protein YeaQ/YmgE (transglycosylase-associated protein family)
MEFVTGFLVWLAFGLIAGIAAWMTYRAAGTTAVLTILFGVFGAFIGGMLGMSGYIFHNPMPLRIGGLVAAAVGAVFFSFLYHFVARRAI